jgi:FMN reductase
VGGSVRVTTIVGNPASPSRTGVTAERFSEVLSELGGQVTTVDLALIPVNGLAHGRPEPEAQRALDAVSAGDLLLVVTPIFKATYTGLLKVLFDGFQGDALRGKVAIPVMLGAWPGHLLALEHALKPVLAALGATPTEGVFVAEQSVDKEKRTVADDAVERFSPVAELAMRMVEVLAEQSGTGE